MVRATLIFTIKYKKNLLVYIDVKGRLSHISKTAEIIFFSGKVDRRNWLPLQTQTDSVVL